jgi:hypothetical protein
MERSGGRGGRRQGRGRGGGGESGSGKRYLKQNEYLTTGGGGKKHFAKLRFSDTTRQKHFVKLRSSETNC